MKIGIAAPLPKGDPWLKVEWLQQAAVSLGHEVVRCTDQSRITSVLHGCDLTIFAQRNIFGHLPSIRKEVESRTVPVVYLWWDLIATQPGVPLEKQPLFQSFAPMLREADLVLVKERGLLDEYRTLGVNAYWCDQGCPSDMPAVEPVATPKWDLLLWGQCGAYRQRTQAAVAAAKSGFKVAWASSQPVPKGIEQLPWTKPFDLPKLASNARCVLSCGVRNDVEAFVSDQFWMACGMGACVIRRSTPGLLQGPYLPYHTEDAVCDCLTWARKNPDEALQMGREAREWVMTEHTVAANLERGIAIAAQHAMAPALSA